MHRQAPKCNAEKSAPQNDSHQSVERHSIEEYLSLEQARDLFYFDGSVLRNRVTRNKAKAGQPAGSVGAEGYVRVRVGHYKFRAHRIVWLITYGSWPKGQIDHINGVRDDNRLENLRDVTALDNQRNAKIRVDNKSGVTGVEFENGFWIARIKINGKKYRLGRFRTKEAASFARRAAEARIGFHPNHGKTTEARRNGLPSLNAPRILRTA